MDNVDAHTMRPAFPENLKELSELHSHLGGSVDPAIMWELAHSQGIKLPTKDYWDFVDMITARNGNHKSLDDYLMLFRWTELIQSSPISVEHAVYSTIAGAYRKNNITLLELRFNPMKRNRGGEQDLDHIMMAAVRGLDRALLEYPVKAGIIICLDRTFSYKQNDTLLRKALKYQGRGIVGIDFAGPWRKGFRYSDYRDIYRSARKAGLGLTVHAGEDIGHESVDEVIEYLEPDRIGHGIRSVENQKTMDMLRERGIVLETCPSSNLDTHVVRDMDHMRSIYKAIKENRIKYTINTDGAEMLVTNLRKEMNMLLENTVLAKADVVKANKQAFAASFIA
jgi:adenosine deaminase